MKSNSHKTLISKLRQINEELSFLSRPESQAALQRNLDVLIEALTRLRGNIESSSVGARATEIQGPLVQVIKFLEFASSDEVLKTLLLPHRKALKPKRQSVEIPSNLTNAQIRTLLEGDLSKAELKAIAAQRAIAIGKSTKDQVKRDILKNLDRQEGYQRLAS